MIVKYLLKVAMLGSSWVMYLLLALSASRRSASMVERWLFFRKRGSGGDELGDALCDLLEEGDARRRPKALLGAATTASRPRCCSRRCAGRTAGPRRARGGDRRRDDQAPARARARHDAARHPRQQRAVRRAARHGHRRHRGLRRPRRRSEQGRRWTRSWAASPRRSSPPASASSSPSPPSSPTTSSRRRSRDIEDNVALDLASASARFITVGKAVAGLGPRRPRRRRAREARGRQRARPRPSIGRADDARRRGRAEE